MPSPIDMPTLSSRIPYVLPQINTANIMIKRKLGYRDAPADEPTYQTNFEILQAHPSTERINIISSSSQPTNNENFHETKYQTISPTA
jgi:hypothetical protein